MTTRPDGDEAPAVDEEALLAEYEAEKPARRLSGWPLRVVQVLGTILTLYGLWWVFNPMPAQLYLPSFLAVGLTMTFLVYRGWGRPQGATTDNPHLLDWLLAVVALVPFVYIVADWDSFFRRAVVPTDLDVVMGTLAILLVLEAARRTVGLVVPLVVVGFLAYAYFGPYFPGPFATSSFGWERLVGHNMMGTQGVFGVPMEVAATYIILSPRSGSRGRGPAAPSRSPGSCSARCRAPGWPPP